MHPPLYSSLLHHAKFPDRSMALFHLQYTKIVVISLDHFSDSMILDIKNSIVDNYLQHTIDTSYLCMDVHVLLLQIVDELDQ